MYPLLLNAYKMKKKRVEKMENSRNAIELHGITKTFGSVVANENVDFTLRKGEILSLLGENGSGKTTLMNMLSGIYQPDSGTISVNGQQVTISSPEDAKRLGIGMVHQHFKLVENFSAADNIWIGDKASSGLLTEERYKKIEEFSKNYGFEIDPHKFVYDMSVSEKQTIEILKVLYYGADILILDEPTAVLTLQETRKLFAILRKMSKAGCSIIIITHKLNEVMEISDRVMILRKGKSIDTVETAKTNAQELTNMMVGRQVSLSIDRPECEASEALLEVKDLSIQNEEGARAIDNVSFTVHGGEILGVAGVSGCGQKELCEAIAGLQKIESGSILYKGESIEKLPPKEIIKRGISMSFIPEDRLGMGLAASLSITDNMMLKNYALAKGPFVNRKVAAKTADKIIEELEVVTPSKDTPVRRLSGGNVQKVLLGREIEAEPNVIITAYPVRGLDINSSYMIYNTLNAEKEKGVGVLFVGEDLDVMLELCDRIMVLCHGKVTGIVNAKETDKEQLGLLMTDAFSEENAEEQAKATATEESTAEIKIRKPAEKAKKKKEKKPFLRIAKRDDLSTAKSLLFYVAAVLFAIAMGGILVAAMGVNPFEYFKTVLVGCFKNKIYFRGFISVLTPLVITSIGIVFAFKMKFWNLGANGQFIMGAVFAAAVGIALAGNVPQWLCLLLMGVAGAIGGGLLGLIPAVLKVKFDTNETLLTLMFNYIALYILSYLKNTMYFRKLSATGEILRPDFKPLPKGAWMYQFELFGAKIDISLIIAILFVIFTVVYFKFMKKGYEVSVVGDSQNTARYAGMNVSKIVIRTMFLSSAIIGIAGMLHVSGSATGHMLSEGITSDVGWTGIIVAWLAKLNPIGILVGSILMAILQKGTAVAESVFAISSATSTILEGVILFSILAADFFIRYKIVRAGKTKKEEVKKS